MLNLGPKIKLSNTCLAIVALAFLQHATWGVTLFIDESAAWSTPINHGLLLFPSERALACAYLLAAVAALVPGFIRVPVLAAIACITPQQALLFMSAAGEGLAIAGSCFADGVERPRAFILADQCQGIYVAAIHFVFVVADLAWPLFSGEKV